MTNINTPKIRPLYEGQTVEENRDHITQTIEAATFCLLIIYDADGYAVNAFADSEAVKSYAYTLRAAKLTKNGTRWRHCGTDYKNGADISRVTFPNTGNVYEFRLKTT